MAMAFSATGYCLLLPLSENATEGSDFDGGREEAVEVRFPSGFPSSNVALADWLLAGRFFPEDPGAVRLGRIALEQCGFPAQAAEALVGNARRTGRARDWTDALGVLSGVDVSLFPERDALFFEALSNVSGHGVEYSTVRAAALLMRDPGDAAGPREFRNALRLCSSSPSAAPPERLYRALSTMLRNRLARVGEELGTALGAIRLAAALSEEAPPERRSKCGEALVDEALCWARLERDGDVDPTLGVGISLLESAFSFNSEPVEAAMAEGNAFLESGDTNAAVRAWGSASVPNSRVRALLANNAAYVSAVSGGDLEEAMRLADGAVSALPLDSAVLDTLAWLFYLLGDRENAFITMRKALLRSDGIPPREICLHAAAILRSMRKFAAAAEWRRRADIAGAAADASE